MASRDVSVFSAPVSMQLLDLGSILVAYKQVQHTHLRHHATPLDLTELSFSISSCKSYAFFIDYVLLNRPTIQFLVMI